VPRTEPARPAGNRLLTAGVVALLAFGGFNLLRTAADSLTGTAAAPPPSPPVSAAHALPVLAKSPQRTAHASNLAAPLPFAVPTRITVARVGIDAAVIKVGLTRSGAIGVPPLTDALKAAWFDGGPTPGQVGPAVIDAHVDSINVPGHRAAFYPLGAMRPGDRIEVTRSDRQVAEFTVDSVELVRKRDFPTTKVYGSLRYAGLRLITCGGVFRRGEGYVGNVIVYAHLTGRHHA
jgi:hypothetical protein